MSSGDVQDVPWITGVTSEEGLYPVAGKGYRIENRKSLYADLVGFLNRTMYFSEFIAKPEALKTLEDNWDLLAPHFLDYNYTLPKEKHVEVARLVKKHYFGTKKIDEATKSLIKLASDRFFVADSTKAATMLAKVNKQPVWYYYYSYRGAHSFSEVMSKTSTNYGMLFE